MVKQANQTDIQDTVVVFPYNAVKKCQPQWWRARPEAS